MIAGLLLVVASVVVATQVLHHRRQEVEQRRQEVERQIGAHLRDATLAALRNPAPGQPAPSPTR